MTNSRCSRHFTWVACLILAVVCWPTPIRAEEQFEFHHDHILGTSLDIQITANSSKAATAGEQAILSEIQRLSKIVSTYDPDSEFSRWRKSTASQSPVSADLLRLMQRSDAWRTQSNGAFNVGVGAICELWKAAAKQNRLPTAAELSAATAQASQRPWKLDEVNRTAECLSSTPLTFDALAKGDIIDCACQAAMQADRGITGVMVNIGGDLLASGAQASVVSIADPFADAENSPPAVEIQVRNRAVATSGNYRRGYRIGERTYSHIVDPRTGQPVDHVVSSTVIAPTAIDADALATIFSVLPIQESLALAKQLPGVECLLIGKDRQRHVSAGWSALVVPQATLAAAAPSPTLVPCDDTDSKKDKSKADKTAADWGKQFELVVNYEINKPSGGRGYKRPYIAVWLAKEDGTPVRTLNLSIQKNGQKWLRDLRRWYKDDTARKKTDEKDLVKTISSATRAPGTYKLSWDGKNDHGDALPAGKYTVFIEAAREHGTYQLIREEIEIAGQEFTKELKGNVEIKGATLEFRRLSADK